MCEREREREREGGREREREGGREREMERERERQGERPADRHQIGRLAPGASVDRKGDPMWVLISIEILN